MLREAAEPAVGKVMEAVFLAAALGKVSLQIKAELRWSGFTTRAGRQTGKG